MITINERCERCSKKFEMEIDGFETLGDEEQLLAELSDAIEGGDRQRQRMALDALVAGDDAAREIVERARFRVRRVAA